jgi:hypothetical protein
MEIMWTENCMKTKGQKGKAEAGTEKSKYGMW